MNVEDGVDLSPIWLADPRAYHVHFWRLLAAPSHWESAEHRLSEVRDITEVFEWAQAHADGRRYVVYVEVAPRGGGYPGLLQVYGLDPTRD